jgi:hypothetical protein
MLEEDDVSEDEWFEVLNEGTSSEDEPQRRPLEKGASLTLRRFSPIEKF